MISLRVALLLTVAPILVSCSSSKTATDTERSPRLDAYPSWYYTEVRAEGSDFFGYASALSADSATAAGQAVRQARARLEAGLSRKLEAARKEVVEKGENAGLDQSRFIRELRNAEGALSEAARTVRSEVIPTESQSGYRAFAEVAISKGKITVRLDRALSEYKEAWNLMKRSQAYKML